MNIAGDVDIPPDAAVRAANAAGSGVRMHLALVIAAVALLPLAIAPDAFRPYVGPKLVLALALGSLALPLLAIGPGPERLGRAALVALGAYVLAYGAATALSLDPLVSLAGEPRRGMGLATRLALLAVAVVAGAAGAGRPDATRWVLRTVLGVCSVESAYVLLQAFKLDPLLDPSILLQTNRAGVVEFRPIGTLGHSNFVGHLLLFGVGAAVALGGLERARAARAAACAGGALTALGIVAAGSRGAWVGLGVQAAVGACVGMWVWRPGKGATRFVPAALLAFALVGGAVVFVARGPLAEQLAARIETFRSDNLTGSGRTILWRDALPMLLRYWPHGTGPEVFAVAFLPYHSADLTRAEPHAVYDSAHNVVLDAAITAGLGGLGGFVALVAVALAALARSARSRAAPGRAAPLGLGLGLAGYLVGGMFIFDTVATAAYFYLFVALSVALHRSERPVAVARAPWRGAIAVVLLLAAGGLLWPRLWLAWRSDAQMAEALRFVARGALPEAIAFGRAAVENARALGPASEQRRQLGRICAHAGDPSRAPTEDERAIFEEGRAEVERARQHSIVPHLLHVDYGNLSLRLGDLGAVERAFRASVALAPTYWYGHARLAYILDVLGDEDGALREASLALELNPESDVVKDLLRDISGA
jgi:O-antigen ligase